MTSLAVETSPEQRMIELGLSLPNVPTPIANFVPFRRDGDRIFLAGQICEWNGEVRYRGKLGVEHELADGQEAARICALNLLAALREACGGDARPRHRLPARRRLRQLRARLLQVPQVINGASDLIHALFGERGLHARTAIGVASLPQGAAVEVDAIFAID